MKILATSVILLMLTASAIAADRIPSEVVREESSLQKKETIIYVTRTGKRYHTAGCRYLMMGKKIPMTLEKAEVEGYTPCKVCGGVPKTVN